MTEVGLDSVPWRGKRSSYNGYIHNTQKEDKGVSGPTTPFVRGRVGPDRRSDSDTPTLDKRDGPRRARGERAPHNRLRVRNGTSVGRQGRPGGVFRRKPPASLASTPPWRIGRRESRRGEPHIDKGRSTTGTGSAGVTCRRAQSQGGPEIRLGDPSAKLRQTEKTSRPPSYIRKGESTPEVGSEPPATTSCVGYGRGGGASEREWRRR